MWLTARVQTFHVANKRSHDEQTYMYNKNAFIFITDGVELTHG